MGSTFLSLHYHIVFSTKERRPLIKAAWRAKLHEYLGGTLKGLDASPQIIGGIEDHVHILTGLRATHCLADIMRELKKASSRWVLEKFDPAFGWQDGYAAFTVSNSHLAAVREYIAHQEEHHQKLGFIDELKRLLEKNDVKFDPQYLL